AERPERDDERGKLQERNERPVHKAPHGSSDDADGDPRGNRDVCVRVEPQLDLMMRSRQGEHGLSAAYTRKEQYPADREVDARGNDDERLAYREQDNLGGVQRDQLEVAAREEAVGRRCGPEVGVWPVQEEG